MKPIIIKMSGENIAFNDEGTMKTFALLKPGTRVDVGGVLIELKFKVESPDYIKFYT